jgi:membrane-associated phospholipid phosphatase
MHHRRWQALSLAIVACAAPARSAAQAEAPARGAMFTARDAAILGATTAAGFLLIGFDERIATQVRESPLQRSGGTTNAMQVAGVVGEPGAVFAGAALWLNGRLSKDRTRELIGLRSLEAIAATGAVTVAIKAITGRARPDESPFAARDFRLGRGFGDRNEFQSFPSGHVTVAFAFASAVDAELNRVAPKHPGWIVPTLYALATATAASRVYRNRHWTSDVVLGSAIGFVGGHAVVRWHNDRPEARRQGGNEAEGVRR